MYELYVDWCHDEGHEPQKEWLYREIFVSEYNLGFQHPKKDLCDVCETFTNTQHPDQAMMESHHEHMQRKEESRKHKLIDKQEAIQNPKHIVATFDLEKILVVPSLEVSRLYYLRKLSTYNFTIFNLANREVSCFMWYESQGGKGSSENATCLEDWLKALPKDTEKVTLYSDTAAGQNRNSINAGMIICFLHEGTHAVGIVDQKFMESGHSQMEVDCVHSTIERKGQTNKIYTPFDWYAIARCCRPKQPYRVIEMDYSSFRNHKESSGKIMKNKSTTDNGKKNKVD